MKLFNKKLIMTGTGTILGLIIGILVREPAKIINLEYNDEISSVIVVLIGSILMASPQKNLNKLGTGIGSVGVAVLGRSLFFQMTGERSYADPETEPDEKGFYPGGEWQLT